MELMRTVPFAHQTEAFTLSHDVPVFALFMEAGTGKTRVTIETAIQLYIHGKIDSLLIFAPNGVHRKWLEEFRIHVLDVVPLGMAYYEAGAGKQATANFEKTVAFRGGLRVLSYNLDTLSNERNVKMILSHLKNRKTMVVIDESHKIKTPSAKRTRNSYKVSAASDFARILTGTPIGLGLQDLYSQFKFLDWRIIGCRTYTEFKSRYCIIGGFENRQIVGYQNVKELLSKIKPYVYEKNKADCLDLPPETWITVEVDLSPEQRRLYKEIRDEFIASILGNTLEADQAGVRMIRLRQILSGLFATPDGSEPTINIPCPRLERCADIVEEASRGKVIVWCHFKQDILNNMKTLKERGIQSLPYYGGISQEQRSTNLAQWKTDPAVVVLVATPATGGTGEDMYQAATDITYSHDYNFINYVQKGSRNHRSGQTKPVTHYNLVARGTADVKMLKRTQERGSVADLLKGMNKNELLDLLRDDF